jgi:DNA repair protein RadA/Sms
VAQQAARLKEAAKLGFARAVAPEAARTETPAGLTLQEVGGLPSLVADIASRGNRLKSVS